MAAMGAAAPSSASRRADPGRCHAARWWPAFLPSASRIFTPPAQSSWSYSARRSSGSAVMWPGSIAENAKPSARRVDDLRRTARPDRASHYRGRRAHASLERAHDLTLASPRLATTSRARCVLPPFAPGRRGRQSAHHQGRGGHYVVIIVLSCGPSRGVTTQRRLQFNEQRAPPRRTFKTTEARGPSTAAFSSAASAPTSATGVPSTAVMTSPV